MLHEPPTAACLHLIIPIRRPYPRTLRKMPAPATGPVNEPAIGAATERNLDAVLARYNGVLDIVTQTDVMAALGGVDRLQPAAP